MADDISIKLATSEDAGAVLQFLRVTATESDAVLVPHLNEISEKTEAKKSTRVKFDRELLKSLV